MADYILLEGGDKGDRVRVVVHTAVPNSNNSVQVKWRDALVAWSQTVKEGTVSEVPVSFLPAGVQADLDTGALYEWEFVFVDDANLPDSQRITNLETEVANREADELTRLQTILDYYGKTGTV